MEEDAVPADRCGYRYDVSTVHDLGACACWRRTWGDSERCVWHADAGEKPREALAEAIPESGERLDGAVLRKTSLGGVDWFEDCVVVGAELAATDLRDATLAGADFREARLDHVDMRRSDCSGVNLEDATLSVCDFRHANLRNVRLDHAVFSHTRISRETTFGTTSVYEDELETADRSYQRTAEAAIWAYREVHDLHQENALPVEARHYYLREKNVRRKLAWYAGHYARAVMSEAARWTTGYGMSPWRVIGTALLIVVLAAVLYPTTGGLQETVPTGESPGGDVEGGSASSQRTITWTIENPQDAPRYWLALVFFRSLYFSVVTFTTLGYGDISPVGDVARAIAGVEALLGQLFMALLVFVLTRRIS